MTERPDLGGGSLPSTLTKDRRRNVLLKHARPGSSQRIEPYPKTRPGRSGVVSNDDGTPKAVASTAGSSGFIKGAYSVTGSPNGPKERSVVHARTKLFYFRNQTITRNDISAIIPYHEPGSAVFQNWETQIIKWRNDLQKNIWDGAWFLNFVRTRVDEYDATTQDDRHATLTGINRSDFWAHESRLSRDTIFKLFSPLSSSVDLDQVWEDAVWNKYVRRVYTVACISIWRNRIKEEHGKPA